MTGLWAGNCATIQKVLILKFSLFDSPFTSYLAVRKTGSQARPILRASRCWVIRHNGNYLHNVQKTSGKLAFSASSATETGKCETVAKGNKYGAVAKHG